MDNVISVDWDDNRWLKFKLNLQEVLYNNDVEIFYRKADGSTRTMLVTKKTTSIIIGLQKTNKKTNKKNWKKNDVNSILVWDLEKEDWRTIKTKNIINILTLILKYDLMAND